MSWGNGAEIDLIMFDTMDEWTCVFIEECQCARVARQRCLYILLQDPSLGILSPSRTDHQSFTEYLTAFTDENLQT